MSVHVEKWTPEGYAETLRLAARSIEERAAELIGNIDLTTGISVTINIAPGDVATIVAKKTIYVKRAEETE